jgi:hypothetical protein
VQRQDVNRSKYWLPCFILLAFAPGSLFAADPPPFSPQEYKISIKADPQLQKDTDKLVGDSYVYVVKGQIFEHPVPLDPVAEDQNTFQNPFKVIGRFLAVAPSANKDAILKLYDSDSVPYITKKFLSDPTITARWTAALANFQGFNVKAIFQESDTLWLIVGYPVMNGKTDAYLLPFSVKEGKGGFILNAPQGDPSKDFMNIQSVIGFKGMEGLTYQVVPPAH